MKKKDPKIIRIGDTVKIIEPRFFVRCGYPLSVEEAALYIQEKHEIQVNSFLEDLGLRDFVNHGEIYRALGYAHCKSRGFGGNNREIYDMKLDELKNLKYEVMSTFFVKTGIYVPASGGYNYDGGYDVDYAYLKNEKTHKILQIYCVGRGPKMIEACHVEKI